MPRDLPPTAEAAEEESRSIVGEMLQALHSITAPQEKRAAHLAEQLSFLQTRDNFRAFKILQEQGEDVPAATLARALFEESMRWAWVDEDPEDRTSAFFGEAVRAHRLIHEAGVAQGIDTDMFFGPLVAKELLPAAADVTLRFPPQFERLMDWMTGDVAGMHYLQYRVLSQYVHSSLLSAASTAVEIDGRLENSRVLPLAARLTVIRNAAASMTFVFEETREGLEWPGHPALNFLLLSASARIAEITYPFAPASA
jgi:hypothetical protein